MQNVEQARQRLFAANAALDCRARDRRHADGDRLAVQKRKIAALLHRVTKRVAQVQRAAAAEVVLVRADDVALHLHADLDDVLVLLTHGRFVEFFKERCIAEHRILDDLGAAAAVLLLGQRFERVGITDHDAGLIEAARLILARWAGRRRVLPPTDDRPQASSVVGILGKAMPR